MIPHCVVTEIRRVKFLVEIEQHYYDLRTVTCNKSNKVRCPCFFFFTCIFYFMIFDLFRSMYTILVYNVQMYSKYNLSRLCTARNNINTTKLIILLFFHLYVFFILYLLLFVTTTTNSSIIFNFLNNNIHYDKKWNVLVVKTSVKTLIFRRRESISLVCMK